MNKIYKIVNTDTQKTICKFSVAGDETLDLLAAIKFVGGILSADNTEASFDNGQSYIKIFDLYLAEISRLPTANLTDHIEIQDQNISSVNSAPTKNNKKKKKDKKIKAPKAGAIGAILIIAGIILFGIGIATQLPPKDLSYHDSKDSYKVEEYINGDAYNYLIAATQWAGEYSAKSTEKALYICFGISLFSLGAVIGEIEWRKAVKEHEDKKKLVSINADKR